MDIKALFRPRAFAIRNISVDDGDFQADINPRGELIVVQGLPERAEIVRNGNSWVKVTDAAVCVTAIPTTTAPHTLWNGEPAGGKSLVIDSIAWSCSTSAGVASMFAMLAMLNILPVTAAPATADSATSFSSLNGKKYGGRAISSHTVTVVDDKWWPIGPTFHSGALTATVGIGLEQAVNGLIVVPPGCTLALAVIAANTTAAGKFAIRFHEVQIPNLQS